MAAAEVTVPVEATAPARDSCCTVKLSWPAGAFEVAVAVTAVLDDVAFIARHPATRARSWALEASAENFVLSAW
jgi:hypothetical protein